MNPTPSHAVRPLPEQAATPIPLKEHSLSEAFQIGYATAKDELELVKKQRDHAVAMMKQVHDSLEKRCTSLNVLEIQILKSTIESCEPAIAKARGTTKEGR